MEKEGRYEYWKGRDGKWYWHQVAANGEILGHSQDYTRPENARKGIDASIGVALDADGNPKRIVKLKAPPKK